MVKPVVSSRTRFNGREVWMRKEADSGFEYLDTVAGGLEEGEWPLEAMIRELKEETGRKAYQVKQVSACPPYIQVSDDTEYLVYPHDIELKTPPLAVSEEHEDVTIVQRSRLRDLYEEGVLPAWKLQNTIYIEEAEKHGVTGLEIDQYPVRIGKDEMPTRDIF